MRLLPTPAALALFCSLSLFSACQKNNLPVPLQETLTQYDAIQEALASDSTSGVKEAAFKIEVLTDLDNTGTLPKELKGQASALAEATTIKQMRTALKPISNTLITVLAARSEKSGLYEAHCPMAEASWIQTKQELRNPYYGKSMLDCGSIKREL